jgi:hypothetical protein
MPKAFPTEFRDEVVRVAQSVNNRSNRPRRTSGSPNHVCIVGSPSTRSRPVIGPVSPRPMPRDPRAEETQQNP